MSSNSLAALIGAILFSIIAGVMAQNKGRSFWIFFILSLFSSPIIIIIIILCIGEKYIYYCPDCGNTEKAIKDANQACSKCNNGFQLYFTDMRVKDYESISYNDKCKLKEEWKSKSDLQPRVLVDNSEKNNSKEYKWQCSACHHTLTGWYKTCPDCGSMDTIVKMEQPVTVQQPVNTYCTNCGAQLDSDSAFCPFCGSKVE